MKIFKLIITLVLCLVVGYLFSMYVKKEKNVVRRESLAPPASSENINPDFAIQNVKYGINVPKIMFWWGKVNQHWDLERREWQTDEDGSSGAKENKLEYCRKFYPETVKVVVYKPETIQTWRASGNSGEYASTKISYRCVLVNENVDGEDVSNLPEEVGENHTPIIPRSSN